MATAALVCGIIAVVFGTVLGFLVLTLPLAFILGVVAVILGVLGVRRAREAAGLGRGQAIAGIVTGAVALVAALLWGFAFGALFAGFEGMVDDPESFMEDLEEFEGLEGTDQGA